MTRKPGSHIARASGAVVTVVLLALAVLVRSGLLLPLAVLLFVAWLARKLRRAPVPTVTRAPVPPVSADAELKLAILRARLTAQEIALVLKSPDMAQAARDLARGKITAADYEAALIAAGDEARIRQEERARPTSRFRFR